MKKLVSILLVCLLTFCMAVPAFADLGEPEFNNWFVVCGMAGYDFRDAWIDYDRNTEVPFNDHIEPGIRLQVYAFDEATREYTLIISDPNHNTKGYGFVIVTESELNSRFLELNRTVDPQKGTKLASAVTAKVTPRVGVVLRQGPAKTFPKYTTVPQNTQVTYEYVYDYGGYHWGYISYKGYNGWACIDYMEATTVPTTAAPTTAPTTEPTTTAAPTAPSTEATSAAESQNAGVDENTGEKEEEKGLIGGLSQTKLIILMCCVIAIMLSVIGIVVLFVIKKSKNS